MEEVAQPVKYLVLRHELPEDLSSNPQGHVKVSDLVQASDPSAGSGETGRS